MTLFIRVELKPIQTTRFQFTTIIRRLRPKRLLLGILIAFILFISAAFPLGYGEMPAAKLQPTSTPSAIDDSRVRQVEVLVRYDRFIPMIDAKRRITLAKDGTLVVEDNVFGTVQEPGQTISVMKVPPDTVKVMVKRLQGWAALNKKQPPSVPDGPEFTIWAMGKAVSSGGGKGTPALFEEVRKAMESLGEAAEK